MGPGMGRAAGRGMPPNMPQMGGPPHPGMGAPMHGGPMPGMNYCLLLYMFIYFVSRPIPGLNMFIIVMVISEIFS